MEKPNSSAPNKAPTITSFPVLKPPSTCKEILLLKLLSTKVCWVSASPNSHGDPACFIEVSGLAPVPPSNPDIVIWSALAFATPAATVPTPTSETSFTEILAFGFTFFKSKINCAKSSIEYMSWCGGGDINPTPGVENLTSAITWSTLWPGNCPPSPGLAPWAILICISVLFTRYSVVTPNLPEATCFMALFKLSPFFLNLYLSLSSPPSPVFDLPPSEFIAIASVVCASLLIDPKDMAPVENLFTILSAGSTSLRLIFFFAFLIENKLLGFRIPFLSPLI